MNASTFGLSFFNIQTFGWGVFDGKRLFYITWVRKWMKYATIYIVITVFSQSAHGSEAAKQLVKALGRENDFGSTVELCKSNAGMPTARELLDLNPEYFYRFNPGSKAWPRVLKILDS